MSIKSGQNERKSHIMFHRISVLAKSYWRNVEMERIEEGNLPMYLL